MAVPDFFSNLLSGVRRASGRVARSFTQTFKPGTTATSVISLPPSREHIRDILADRQSESSSVLLARMFRHDPDVSAAVGAYLTLSDTPMRIISRNDEGEIDVAATREAEKIWRALTNVTEYSKGYQNKPGAVRLCQELRHMLMLRGSIGAEVVFNSSLVPQRLQQVDMSTIEYFEAESGVYTPRQKTVAGPYVDLNIPNFFVSYHRRLPTSPYSDSDFVSAINTIAARAQVINDLYRIMQIVGFPRMEITVLEEVLRANMPTEFADDPELARTWLQGELQSVSQTFANIRSDQPIAHFDSTALNILNKENPGAALQISEVIEVLNGMNQAGLKTMATIIGRGKAGTNTASTEARIAAMNADQLNIGVAELLSRVLSYLLNLYGTAGYVEVTFQSAELRPNLELEPQRVAKQARLLRDLSLGLITDVEYSLEMHNRLPYADAPQLSGTRFATEPPRVSTDEISPNSDPLGRSIAA